MVPELFRGKKGLILAGLSAFVFLFASWTLAASLVENSLECIPDVRVAAATDPLVAPAAPPLSEGAAQLADGPLAPAAAPPVAQSEASPAQEAGNVDLAPPPAPSPAPAGPPLGPDAAQKALRLSAFPAEQFSSERLGSNPHAGKRIALTFDDGPVSGWTDKYLAVLREQRAVATFFLIGRSAQKDPRLVLDVLADGHEVGAHSYSHKKLSLLKKPAVREELWGTGTTLYEITARPVAYFRPPYGAMSPIVAKVAAELGQTIILWNVDPRDWEASRPEQIVNHVLSRVRPGSIILLHEGKRQTLEALPGLITKLRAQGYEFVTISQLFGHSLPKPEEHVVVEKPVTGSAVTR